jgi:hypothetical protein
MTTHASHRRRPSSLQVFAASLPSMETLLDACIERANELDVGDWEDSERREADELRSKAADHKLREHRAREAALLRQLETLQSQVAVAEADASSALADSTEATDLQTRVVEAEQHACAAEETVERIQALVASRQQAVERVAGERVEIAEAAAAKAIAAARAAVAGLTIAPAELAAIERGLPPVPARARGHASIAIAAAFLGGIGSMFAATRVVGRAHPIIVARPAPIATPSLPARPAPIVTPIEPVIAAPSPRSTPVARTVSPSKARPRRTTTPALVDPFGAAKDNSLVDPFKEVP